MARFFVEPAAITDHEQVVITGEDAGHILRVLRLGKGDAITVTSGQGLDYAVVITATSKGEVQGKILATTVVDREPPVKIVLAQGLPKGDKLELIIQKNTELGMSRLVPVQAKRSVVVLKEDKAGKRVERWQRIALEAAKQCQRGIVPEISMVTDWEKALDLVPAEALLLIPWEGETETTLKSVLEQPCTFREIWIFIGPEGGLAPEEVKKAQERGGVTVTLGPRILRTETAGLAVMSMLLYRWGDLGGTS